MCPWLRRWRACGVRVAEECCPARSARLFWLHELTYRCVSPQVPVLRGRLMDGSHLSGRGSVVLPAAVRSAPCCGVQVAEASECAATRSPLSKLLVRKCDTGLTATAIRSIVLYTSLLHGGQCVCLVGAHALRFGSQRGRQDADLLTSLRCALHELQGINSLLLLRRRSTPAPSCLQTP